MDFAGWPERASGIADPQVHMGAGYEGRLSEGCLEEGRFNPCHPERGGAHATTQSKDLCIFTRRPITSTSCRIGRELYMLASRAISESEYTSIRPGRLKDSRQDINWIGWCTGRNFNMYATQSRARSK